MIVNIIDYTLKNIIWKIGLSQVQKFS